MFPAVEVDADALYVDEGAVLTSAGLCAGIDLCLHIVRARPRRARSARGSRARWSPPRTATAARRSSSSAPLPPTGGDGSLEEVRAWALEHLDRAARRRRRSPRAPAVSPRTFARRFVAETGTTPLKWLHAQRVLEARRLLEHTDLPVEQVAARAGFGSAPSLREHFRRATARRRPPTAGRSRPA